MEKSALVAIKNFPNFPKTYNLTVLEKNYVLAGDALITNCVYTKRVFGCDFYPWEKFLRYINDQVKLFARSLL